MKLKKIAKKSLSMLLVTVLAVSGLVLDNSSVLTVKAEESSSTPPSVTAFATPEQLMSRDNFALHTDYSGKAQKVYFGTNGNSQQTWYIAGSDADNSIVLLCDPALPMATSTMFEYDYANNKTYEGSWDCIYGTAPSEVYPNHYGASDLRLNTLKKLETDTNIFTTSEQNMMLATKVYTDDDKLKDDGNSEYTYYTEDKLYAAYGDYSDDKYITVGTNSADKLNGEIKVSLTSAPYDRGDIFWLRAPNSNSSYFALVAYPGYSVDYDYVDFDYSVVPAFRLNLSSVLFTSAASAAISDTAELGVIAEGSAMTLRLDGSNSGSTIAIGEVLYDADKGLILAKKDASAGTVALVVQGNDGTNDWYYSKTIGGTEWISTTDIESALSITDISLSDCKIWLETTDATGSSLRYAVMAEEAELTAIDTIEITGIDTPAGGTAFDTSAVSATAGLAKTDLTVAWTKSGVAAGETANYDTTYTAGITLTPAEKAAFVSGATATVNGNTATVTPNTDGTVTVTYNFTTAKRKLVNIAAPAVPENNRFTSGYTAENVLASTELGTTVQVTLEGTTEPVTVDMAVEWSLANEDNAEYDITSSATNTFKWTVKEDAYVGYDTNNVALEGTVDIKNACTKHIPYEDDGDCTTAIKCSVCGTVTTEAGHVDANEDGYCDNCNSFADGIGAQLTGYSLSLNGNIGVNFYMELDDEVANSDTAKMVFTLPNGDTKEIMVSSIEPTVSNGRTCYIFSCDVSAKEMTAEIKAQIIMGEQKGTVYTYTVKDYADYILEHESEYPDVAPLVKAMLNYGAYSQTYFNYNTGALANADLGDDKALTEVTADSLSGYATEITSNEAVCTFASAYLSLKSETSVTVKVKLAEGATDAKFYINNTELDSTEYSQSGDYYVLTVDGIKASALDTMYEFKVTATVNESTQEAVLKYGALSYCRSILSGTYDQKLKDVATALRLFNIAADEYIAN